MDVKHTYHLDEHTISNFNFLFKINKSYLITIRLKLYFFVNRSHFIKLLRSVICISNSNPTNFKFLGKLVVQHDIKT